MDARSLELWLVRHGETMASAAKRIAGWLDTPLTPRGREEARALRPVLDGRRFDGVWSSDLSRAVETARLAWGEAVPDRRLREVSFGDLEGRPFAETGVPADRQVLAFRGFAAPGGEHLDQARERVSGFLEALPDGRHLLFVHGGVIRLLTQDVGLDAFLPTGSVLGLAWLPRRILFVRMPPGKRPFGAGPDLDLRGLPVVDWTTGLGSSAS